MRVEETWKLGRKGIDDGVLLVVAKNDRKLRIEVGYGLEGVLNDATAKRIIEEEHHAALQAGRLLRRHQRRRRAHHQGHRRRAAAAAQVAPATGRRT